MGEHTAKKIGELNGPWAILLRVCLASYPMLLAWATWVTVETFQAKAWREHDDHFTQQQAAQMQSKIDARFDALPPQDWRDLIKQLAVDVRAMQAVLQENQVKLVRLETLWTQHIEQDRLRGKP